MEWALCVCISIYMYMCMYVYDVWGYGQLDVLCINACDLIESLHGI